MKFHQEFWRSAVLGAAIAATTPAALGADTPSLSEGNWQIQGIQEQRGPYSGEIEIREGPDGEYRVTRIADFEQFSFEGLQLEEVWTGTAQQTDAGIEIHYVLKQSDFIRTLDGVSRTEEQRIPDTIDVTEENGTLSFDLPGLGNYVETITGQSDLSADPLYPSDDTLLAAYSKPGFFDRLFLDLLFGSFQNQPALSAFHDLPGYQEGVQYVEMDHSDYAFYQAHPEKIRVVGKIPDSIALTESIPRHHAYSSSLEAKADYFQSNMSRHINSSGMVTSAIVNDQDQFVAEYPDGDSALWTGVYVMSQGLRYAMTSDPDALAEMKHSLQALMTLVDITGDPTNFARTLENYDPSQPIPSGWNRGTGQYSNLIWLEMGNNDMYKGLIQGFLAGWLFLPHSEDAFRAEIAKHVANIGALAMADAKPLNRPAADGLVALYFPTQDNLNQYRQSLANIPSWVSEYLDLTFDWAGMIDWSGTNLEAMSSLNQIWISQALGEQDTSRAFRKTFYEEWKKIDLEQRHLVTILTQGLVQEAGLVPDEDQDELAASVQRAVWGLREIPAPRPRYNATIDFSLRPDWCPSPYPQMPWKMLSDPPPMTWFIQGSIAPPLFEFGAWGEDYIWKSDAFGYTTGVSKEVEYQGVDYLYAYWMSRYFHIL